MELDTTRPQIGRIYDFMLGGHHNYEVDRQAAANILKVFPSYPRWARLNRWFLQFVASKWAEDGVERILDIASGLPTQGHFTDFLPDARILLSDNDPLSVAYGEEILKDNPNVKYVQAEAGQPGRLIEAASAFFGADRKVAVGCIGIAYFIPDDELRELMRGLHAWCAPGSVMGASIIHPLEQRGALDEIGATMKQFSGAQVYYRTAAQMAEVVAPWKVTKCEPIQKWLDVPDMFSQEELDQIGGYMAGMFLER